MKFDIATLKMCLGEKPEVAAAYLFGSAVKAESVVNDLDILVLLQPDVDRDDVYFDLSHSLGKALGIPEDKIDLLLFNLNEAEPRILYNAVNHGVLLKNTSPDILGNSIDALSRHFMENEPMIERAKRLRNDRLEAFCADR